MRKALSSALVMGLAVAASGCYHATVNTGRPQSGQVVEKDWAHGFLYGLVPPSTMEVAQQCPNGVAQVETQLSFVNQLASILTGGIYTPMEITVRCAAAGTALAEPGLSVPANATAQQVREVFAEAARVSAETGEPATVHFLAE
jgi:hypothetical protein